MAGAFGADGYGVETVSELDKVLQLVFSMQMQGPVIINVAIDPSSSRKPQVSCCSYENIGKVVASYRELYLIDVV